MTRMLKPSPPDGFLTVRSLPETNQDHTFEVVGEVFVTEAIVSSSLTFGYAVILTRIPARWAVLTLEA